MLQRYVNRNLKLPLSPSRSKGRCGMRALEAATLKSQLHISIQQNVPRGNRLHVSGSLGFLPRCSYGDASSQTVTFACTTQSH